MAGRSLKPGWSGVLDLVGGPDRRGDENLSRWQQSKVPKHRVARVSVSRL